MKSIEVVAAIIMQDEKIFATQRGYGAYAGKWEFPGGKIETGERPEEALVREIEEELDVTIEVGRFVCTVEYDYPEFHLTMHNYLSTIANGSLVLKEHSAARWVDAQSIDELDWLPADVMVIDSLKEMGIV